MDSKAFGLLAEIAEQISSGELYREFLSVPALSCGIYTLAAGATDPQIPHPEDEIYYVIRGHARLRVGDEEHDAVPGSILYVRASVEHGFVEIEEEITLLVIFAPAEGDVD